MRICKLDKTEQIWGRGGPSTGSTTNPVSYLASGAGFVGGSANFQSSIPPNAASTFNVDPKFVPNPQLNQFFNDVSSISCNIVVGGIVSTAVPVAGLPANIVSNGAGFFAGTLFCPSSSSSSPSPSPSPSYSPSPSPSCNPSTSCCSSSGE
jgi:hypothetical protein